MQGNHQAGTGHFHARKDTGGTNDINEGSVPVLTLLTAPVSFLQLANNKGSPH